MIRLVLLFALPQEYAYLKRLIGSWGLKTRKPFKSFVCSVAPNHRKLPVTTNHENPPHVSFPKERQHEDLSFYIKRQGGFHFKELILIETGMGQNRMVEALAWLYEWTHPDLVVAAGFAGSLTQDLKVGDVCLGETFSSLDFPSHSQSRPRINQSISESLMQFCTEQRIKRTRIVTAGQPKPKQLLSREFEDTASIMDMESYFVAQFCSQNHIPFLSLRAISDGVSDEIDFDLTAISDDRGRVKIPLVLASVLRNPRLLRSYYLSWKRSQMAAKNLGRVLYSFLNLSITEILTQGLENCLTTVSE